MNMSRQIAPLTTLLVSMPVTTRSAKPERAKEDWHSYLVEQRETLGVL